MNGNELTANAGQTLPPGYESGAAEPPSYESVMLADRARFRSLETTVQEKAHRLIITTSEEHQCQPKELAKSLANYLIETFGLTDTRLSSTGSVNSNVDNCTDPDQWNWDSWERLLYEPIFLGRYGGNAHSVKEDELLGNVEIKINVHLSDAMLFSQLKRLPSVKGAVGAWKLQDMNSFLEIKDVLRHQCLTVTPIIKDCIRNGLFPREFIDELYDMPNSGGISQQGR